MINKRIQSRFGLTLLEMMVVVAMTGLIVTATLAVYQRMRGTATRLIGSMEQSQLEDEVLQKIAEDIDRLAAPGFEATINFRNKLNNGYISARLILENSYYGNNSRKKTFERIIWQTWYSPQDDVLYLYRMHDGLNVEDKVLEKNPEDSPSAGLFIPVARGVTFFELRAQQGETILSAWTSEKLPRAVRVGISFAPLQELADGSIGVPDEDITYRTIAIDRTRMIPYQFIKRDLDLGLLDEQQQDPNDLSMDTTGMIDGDLQESETESGGDDIK